MRSALQDPGTYFFHVRIFLGMIVSLALAQLIRALVQVVRRERTEPLYWVQLVWFASTFLFLVHFWWWELRFAGTADWTFHVYFFLILYAVLLYLLVVLLFPEESAKDVDQRAHFYGRRIWFFGVLALLYLVDFADTWLKGAEFFRSLGIEYIVRNLLYVAACAVAIRTRNPKYHAGFAVLGLAYQVAWILRVYDRLY